MDIQKFQSHKKKKWAKELPQYFSSRKNLTAAILFTDIRNPMRELDVTMYEMLVGYNLPTLIVLTKKDKISIDDAETAEKNISHVFGSCISFSIEESISIELLIKEINELLSS